MQPQVARLGSGRHSCPAVCPSARFPWASDDDLPEPAGNHITNGKTVRSQNLGPSGQTSGRRRVKRFWPPTRCTLVFGGHPAGLRRSLCSKEVLSRRVVVVEVEIERVKRFARGSDSGPCQGGGGPCGHTTALENSAGRQTSHPPQPPSRAPTIQGTDVSTRERARAKAEGKTLRTRQPVCDDGLREQKGGRPSAFDSPYQVELNDGSPCEPLVAKMGRGEGELEV